MILFCRRILKFFSPRRYQIQNNASPVIIFFRLCLLKGPPPPPTKASTVDLSRLNTLRGTLTAFNPVAGTTSTPVLFIGFDAYEP